MAAAVLRNKTHYSSNIIIIIIMIMSRAQWRRSMRGCRDIWSVRGLRNLCAHFLPPPPAPDPLPFNRRPCFPHGNIQHVLHVAPAIFSPTLKRRKEGAVTVHRWTGLLIGFVRRSFARIRFPSFGAVIAASTKHKTSNNRP